MYKLDAVRDVVDEYSGPVINMEDVFTKDNGKIAFKFSSLRHGFEDWRSIRDWTLI
jgi:Holliday junction resolvasome RuvABC endonuclease subunit